MCGSVGCLLCWLCIGLHSSYLIVIVVCWPFFVVLALCCFYVWWYVPDKTTHLAKCSWLPLAPTGCSSLSWRSAKTRATKKVMFKRTQMASEFRRDSASFWLLFFSGDPFGWGISSVWPVCLALQEGGEEAEHLSDVHPGTGTTLVFLLCGTRRLNKKKVVPCRGHGFKATSSKRPSPRRIFCKAPSLRAWAPNLWRCWKPNTHMGQVLKSQREAP